jgi:hypothetical protein
MVSLAGVNAQRDDEDEGSSPQGGVNRTITGCCPGRRENRKISGSPPDLEDPYLFPVMKIIIN